MKRHSVIALAAVAASLSLSVPVASAATSRYAIPAGGAVSGSCGAATPCNLPFAVGIAAPGDTVVAKAGTYSLAGLSINTPNVDVVGESGGAKPVLALLGPASFGPAATGAKLRDFVIQGPPALPALVVGGAATMSGLEVTASGACISLNAGGATIADSEMTQAGGFSPCVQSVGLADNTTMRNVKITTGASALPTQALSLIGSGISVDRLVATGGGGVALGGSFLPTGAAAVMRRSRITLNSTTSIPGLNPAGLAISGSVLVTDTTVRASGANTAAVSSIGGKLRNVTAVATGTGSQGLHLPAAIGGAIPTSVRNSIFRADAAASDVVVDPDGPPPAPGLCPPICATTASDLTITHSNFRDKTGALEPASASNQTGDPQFTDLAGGDLRPKTGSPVIDAGTDDADNGTVDLDGNPRKIGSAVDIGAFEFVPPSPPVGAASVPHADPSPLPDVRGPLADLTSPALSALGITNKVFAASSEATPVAARAKKGTTFVYTLSEPATVVIAIERADTGRRKGRSCVKATRANRKARKCTRYVSAGKPLGRPGTLGPNAFPFSGRIGTKALKPGTYRAVLVASDAAGNRSQPKTVAFKIVAR